MTRGQENITKHLLKAPLPAAFRMLIACLLLAGSLGGCSEGENRVANPGTRRTGLWDVPESTRVASPDSMRDRTWLAQVSQDGSIILRLARTDSVTTMIYLRFGSIPDTTGADQAFVGLRFYGGRGSGQLVEAAMVDSSASDWWLPADYRLTWDNQPPLTDFLPAHSLSYTSPGDTSITLVGGLVEIPFSWIRAWKLRPDATNKGMVLRLKEGEAGSFKALSREYAFPESVTVEANPVLSLRSQGIEVAQISPTQDTYIYHDTRQPFPTGTDPVIALTEWPPARGLFRFDLPALPSGSTINRATLRLHCVPPSKDVSVYAYRAGMDWSEGASADASIDSIGSRFAAVAVSSSAGDTTLDVELTALAQAWTDGRTRNQGVVLRLSDEGALEGRLDLFSREAAPEKRPRLELIYARPLDPRLGAVR